MQEVYPYRFDPAAQWVACSNIYPRGAGYSFSPVRRLVPGWVVAWTTVVVGNGFYMHYANRPCHGSQISRCCHQNPTLSMWEEHRISRLLGPRHRVHCSRWGGDGEALMGKTEGRCGSMPGAGLGRKRWGGGSMTGLPVLVGTTDTRGDGYRGCVGVLPMTTRGGRHSRGIFCSTDYRRRRGNMIGRG